MSQVNETLILNEIKIISTLDIAKIFQKFESTSNGLCSRQIASKSKIFGPNMVLDDVHQLSVIRFFKLLLSPLSVLLMALSLISYITGEGEGALIIFMMVFLSTLLSFTQEFKAKKVANKLKKLVSSKVTVVRDGIKIFVDLSEIVPGDMVFISAGDLIPADIRLIDTNDLLVNQSSLTGESMPAEKNHLQSIFKEKYFFDCQNICYMGSHVVSGSAYGIVINTGSRTVFAQLVRDISQQTRQTEFDKGIKKYIWLMIRFMFFIVPLVFLINFLIKGDWVEAALFAIAVSIGLAPEMLPMSVTVSLARGALSMSKKHVIVKRLSAIQNLGAMTILCTDKTGTLTQNEIILEHHIDVCGQESIQVLDFAYLNSYYQAGLKNLLDVAVLKHLDLHHKLHNTDNYKKIDEIPFSFNRRRMSVVVQKNSQSQILICKGAVEEIFACCKYAQVGNDLVILDNDHRHKLQKITNQFNQNGFRVIAIAIKNESISRTSYSVSDESDMTLIGYIAFLDPPKESAKPAICALRDAGIQVKILTGDNELVTKKICHDVGILFDKVILGSDINNMTDEDLVEVAKSSVIFAKMTPHQKARIIGALQVHGHIVGYMGDGINDGPSLKAADIGISVDTGVDIAKDSADIILLEKSLLVLYQGVMEGRKVFGNLMKYLKMTSSSNLGNVISMVGASAFLPFLPMAPVQIILNDLLYDFSQVALPADNVDQECLVNPQNWDMKEVVHYMLFFGPISSFFDCLTFFFLWFSLNANSSELSALFQTGWFIESLLSQTLVVHIIRTRKIPFVESSPSGVLLFTTLAICGVAIFLPYSFLASDLHMQELPAEYWYGILFILISYLAVTQLVKHFLIKQSGFTN